MNRHHFSFLTLLVLTWPLRYLPYRALHLLGSVLGLGLYYLSAKFRKRALSNLALASTLELSPQQIVSLAKRSLQNLMITCLEYPKLASETHIEKVARCVNPDTAFQLLEKGKGVIFFCGHQANWEILFLEGTSRMPGVAIGRPVANPFLYRWVVKIRQKFGGKIIPPQQAIKEGLRALKQGRFLGVVGDQGMPDSGYRSMFLGRPAWTSPMPALLAHRTSTPLIVATTQREQGGYIIRYSEPIWPREQASAQEEVPRLMQEVLSCFEKSVIERPHEWLWSHNRWKQQTPERLRKPFRHDTLLIIIPLPEEVEPGLLKTLLEGLSVFRRLYPYEFITIYTPLSLLEKTKLEGAEMIPYTTAQERFVRDFRFKLLFNWSTDRRLNAHFKRLAAFHTFCLEDLDIDLTRPISFADQLASCLLKPKETHAS